MVSSQTKEMGLVFVEKALEGSSQSSSPETLREESYHGRFLYTLSISTHRPKGKAIHFPLV